MKNLKLITFNRTITFHIHYNLQKDRKIKFK